MAEEWNYSLEGSKGVMVAHDPACPTVRKLADGGVEPVATMLGCSQKLPASVPRHSCLDGKE